MTDMIEKGVSIIPLLNSDIFCEQFDYDEWCGTHWNDKEVMKPYSGSIFRLRNKYKSIFGAKEFSPMPDEEEDKEAYDKFVKLNGKKTRTYKIEYRVNLLPMLGMYTERKKDPFTLIETVEIQNLNTNFLGMCTEVEGDEIDMFET